MQCDILHLYCGLRSQLLCIDISVYVFYFSQVVQEVTRTSLNQTLSWLDLTNFQVNTKNSFFIESIKNIYCTW